MLWLPLLSDSLDNQEERRKGEKGEEPIYLYLLLILVSVYVYTMEEKRKRKLA